MGAGGLLRPGIVPLVPLKTRTKSRRCSLLAPKLCLYRNVRLRGCFSCLAVGSSPGVWFNPNNVVVKDAQIGVHPTQSPQPSQPFWRLLHQLARVSAFQVTCTRIPSFQPVFALSEKPKAAEHFSTQKRGRVYETKKVDQISERVVELLHGVKAVKVLRSFNDITQKSNQKVKRSRSTASCICVFLTAGLSTPPIAEITLKIIIHDSFQRSLLLCKHVYLARPNYGRCCRGSGKEKHVERKLLEMGNHEHMLPTNVQVCPISMSLYCLNT